MKTNTTKKTDHDIDCATNANFEDCGRSDCTCGYEPPQQPEGEWEKEQQRLKEDFDVYLQFIPKAYCQMCDSSKNITKNDEEASNKQYPWFCMECEDASEVIELKSHLIMDIEEEVTQAKEEARREVVEIIKKSLPTHKGKMISRTELKKSLDQISQSIEEGIVK